MATYHSASTEQIGVSTRRAMRPSARQQRDGWRHRWTSSTAWRRRPASGGFPVHQQPSHMGGDGDESADPGGTRLSRGRGTGTGTTSSTRPGAGENTSSRSASITASSM